MKTKISNILERIKLKEGGCPNLGLSEGGYINQRFANEGYDIAIREIEGKIMEIKAEEK